MIRFIVTVLSLLAFLTGNCFADSAKKWSIDPHFFDDYYATFIDRSAGEPLYFIHKITGESLYVGKDIPLKNLIGYRLQRQHFNGIEPADIDVVQSIVINENSTLKDIFFAPSEYAYIATRLCLYAPDGTLVGQKCTDRYFGHTHYPEGSKPANYYYGFDWDFHVTWVADKAEDRQLPFFHNSHTNTNWYLGRDLPISALNGYRLRVRPINMFGHISPGGLDVRIDEQTTIDDLVFNLGRLGGSLNAARICLYNPYGVPVGGNKSCTDPYYGHNYNPYLSEPPDYGYDGKIITVGKEIGPKQDFIDDYGSFSKEISETGEVTFALRFFHNDNIPLTLNLSDAYKIDLKRYKATITDMDSGKRFDFPLQSRNSNLTLSLTVSQGLEANYKRLWMIEDDGDKLYRDSALKLSDITTSDQTIARVISEPFYQIDNPTNTNVEFIRLNANVYLGGTYSHHITKRCFDYHPIIKFLKGMMLGDAGVMGTVCGPLVIRPLNLEYVSPLKKEITHANPLPHAVQDSVGYTLQHSLSLKDEDSVAFLTGIRHCHLDIDHVLEETRHRRAPGGCFDRVQRMTALFAVLRLNIQGMLDTVIDSILNRGVIPGEAYPEGEAPSGGEEEERLIATVNEVGRDEAIEALTTYGAISAQAAAANSQAFYSSDSGDARSGPEIQEAVADGIAGFYRLSSPRDFRPLRNVVRRVANNGTVVEHPDEQYRVRIVEITTANLSRRGDVFDELVTILENWLRVLPRGTWGDVDENQIEYDARSIVTSMLDHIRRYQEGHIFDLPDFLGFVYNMDNELLGLSFGSMRPGATYSADLGVVRPEDLRHIPGAYRSAVAYLRSQMLRRAFTLGAERAEAQAVSPYSAKSVFKLGFWRDEF